MPKTVAIIPARFKSSRFPGKVLADIAGKSLLRRTYEQVSQAKLLTQVIVAADDLAVARHAEEFGAQVVMTDPFLPSGTHRVAAAVHHLQLQAEIIVNVQVDVPCLDPAIVDDLVTCLHQNPDALISTPVTPLSDPEEIHNSSVVKCVFDRTGRALYFSRATIPYLRHPHLPHCYYGHLGVYCFRKHALQDFAAMEQTTLQQVEDLEQLKILEHGGHIQVCIVNSTLATVDTPEDVKKAEALLCQV